MDFGFLKTVKQGGKMQYAQRIDVSCIYAFFLAKKKNKTVDLVLLCGERCALFCVKSNDPFGDRIEKSALSFFFLRINQNSFMT